MSNEQNKFKEKDNINKLNANNHNNEALKTKGIIVSTKSFSTLITQNTNFNDTIVNVETQIQTEVVITKKIPYTKKIVEVSKGEHNLKGIYLYSLIQDSEKNEEVKSKVKKKKNKLKNDYECCDEEDKLKFDGSKGNFEKKNKKAKYSKKKLSHNDMEDGDFNKVLVLFYNNKRMK